MAFDLAKCQEPQDKNHHETYHAFQHHNHIPKIRGLPSEPVRDNRQFPWSAGTSSPPTVLKSKGDLNRHYPAYTHEHNTEQRT